MQRVCLTHPVNVRAFDGGILLEDLDQQLNIWSCRRVGHSEPVHHFAFWNWPLPHGQHGTAQQAQWRIQVSIGRQQIRDGHVVRPLAQPGHERAVVQQRRLRQEKLRGRCAHLSPALL
ncbi:hypothetical protein [Deinococcus sp. RM]|uniref:hypothetical protein n=1 Tax=Deinococcus sp. RM TaxID=2316359 RepID=UPI0011C2299D|nr:hypothetical protein [Deinococcus sp. RM]